MGQVTSWSCTDWSERTEHSLDSESLHMPDTPADLLCSLDFEARGEILLHMQMRLRLYPYAEFSARSHFLAILLFRTPEFRNASCILPPQVYITIKSRPSMLRISVCGQFSKLMLRW